MPDSHRGTMRLLHNSYDKFLTIAVSLGDSIETIIQLCEKNKAKRQRETRKENTRLFQALRPLLHPYTGSTLGPMLHFVMFLLHSCIPFHSCHPA